MLRTAFVAIAGLILLGAPAPSEAVSCQSNGNCLSQYYCRKATGDCGGTGQCEPRPAACPMNWDPVCGCDGKTYSNACSAAGWGVSVLHEGECSATGCHTNNNCQAGFYCGKGVGDCEGLGTCIERPQGCTKMFDPVCGCDDQTYSNACLAALAGVNVRYEGPCTQGCRDNTDCQTSDYCAKANGHCGGLGVCQPRPQFCLEIWAPVCGCDRRTYGNECEAAAIGVSVNYDGVCTPGPTTVMMEPKTTDDDVHTGPSGLDSLRILWSDPVVFTPGDMVIVDQYGALVPFTVVGSTSELMTITFGRTLLYDRYTITIRDSAYSAVDARAIDGDDDGRAGGDAVILLEHRLRSDFNNDNVVDFRDLVYFADAWLAQL